jgi:hypothetical protein
MKKFRNSGPTRLRRVLGNLHIQRRILPIVAVAAGVLTAANAMATEINLVTGTSGAVTSGSFPSGTTPASASTGTAGPDAIYELIDTIPAGTGVFQPFLSYQRRGTEEGVNTSQGGNGQGFIDDKRVPQWTHDLHLNELGTITRNGVSYYAFELDANETGSGNPNRLLSIDDIRIYTSSSSPFNSINNDNQLHAALANDTLGTLRYAQNATPGTTANWVLIDASRRTEGSTSGSGSSDMLVLVPTSLFASAGANDFVTFYTINGVHDTAGDDGSDAGFEEWRALVGAPAVPDGGSTLLLLGSALIPLGLLRARRESNKA